MAITEIANVHVASLHDALQRAVKIAPTKGAAYDKAQGIHLTFAEGCIEVRATNLEMTYWQSIDAEVDYASVGMVVRLPSVVLSSFVGSIPMSKDSDVARFIVDSAAPDKITIRYNKSKLKANIKRIVGGSYPDFGPIELDGMTPAQELASAIEAVTWACDDSGKLAGVLIDGENLIATDSRVMARVNCVVDTPAPMLALLSPLVPLIKLGTNIHIKGIENKLVIALDPRTQVTTTLILEAFPDLIERMRAFKLEEEFQIGRTRFIEALNRISTFIKSSDRLPVCEIRVSEGVVEVALTGDSGDVQDACVVTDQTITIDKVFKFNPQRLTQALDSFTSSTVKINYTPETPTRKPIHIVKIDGEYEAWVIPMSDTAT